MVTGYTQVMEPVLEAPKVELTTADRCDRCGAEARAYAELVTGGILLFCLHDLKKNQEKLDEIKARVEIVKPLEMAGA